MPVSTTTPRPRARRALIAGLALAGALALAGPATSSAAVGRAVWIGSGAQGTAVGRAFWIRSTPKLHAAPAGAPGLRGAGVLFAERDARR